MFRLLPGLTLYLHKSQDPDRLSGGGAFTASKMAGLPLTTAANAAKLCCKPLISLAGAPYGKRTPVPALRGRRRASWVRHHLGARGVRGSCRLRLRHGRKNDGRSSNPGSEAQICFGISARSTGAIRALVAAAGFLETACAGCPGGALRLKSCG